MKELTRMGEVVLNTNFYEQGSQFPSVVETTNYNLAACWNVLNTYVISVQQLYLSRLKLY
jgi:hypothetical protein